MRASLSGPPGEHPSNSVLGELAESSVSFSVVRVLWSAGW